MFSLTLFFLFTKIITQYDYTTIQSPLDIINAIENLSNNIDDVVNRTGARREDVERLFNYSIPCIKNKTLEVASLPRQSFLNLISARKWIKECFSVDDSKYECVDNNTGAGIFWLIQFCAIVFQVIVSFSHRRKKTCLWCCWGRPGVVVPLNMLDSYENRWGMALTFLLTVSQCQAVLLSKYERLFGDEIGEAIKDLPPYASVFIKVACALLISQVAYPFFVCQNMKNKLVGSFIGLFLSVLWLSLEIAKLIHNTKTCWIYWRDSGFGNKYGYLTTMYDWPLYVVLVILSIKFMVTIVTTIMMRKKEYLKKHLHKHKHKLMNHFDEETGRHFEEKAISLTQRFEAWMKHDDTDWKKEYMYQHVQKLFTILPKKKVLHKTTTSKIRKLDEDEEDGEEKNMKEKIKDFIKSKLYHFVPGFKYSTRMMASLLTALFVIYMICAYLIAVGYLLFVKYWKKMFTEEIVQHISSQTNIPGDLIIDYTNSIAASWWLAGGTAALFSALVMLNSLTWYRKHILQLRQGDRTFLPKEFRNHELVRENSVNLMVASLKFAGFQVGYAAWGFLLLFAVLFLCYFIFITQIIIAIKRGENSLLVDLLIKLWPTILVAIVMIVIQKQLAQRVFLLEPEYLAVDNRRTFHIVSYIYFFFNAFLGIASSFLRLVYGLIFGVLFMQRLQRSTLPRSLEIRDPGYLSYIGYILTEHQHANPVMQCFVRILTESLHKKFYEREKTDHRGSMKKTANSLLGGGLVSRDAIDSVKTRNRQRTKALIRWHLYIMLELNPSLKKYRKEELKIRKPKRIIKLLEKGIGSEGMNSFLPIFEKPSVKDISEGESEDGGEFHQDNPLNVMEGEIEIDDKVPLSPPVVENERSPLSPKKTKTKKYVLEDDKNNEDTQF